MRPTIPKANIPRRVRRAARQAEEKVRREHGSKTVKTKTDDPYKTHEYARREDARRLEVTFVRPNAIDGAWKQRNERLLLSSRCTPEEAARYVLEAGRWLSTQGREYDGEEREAIASGYATRALDEMELKTLC